MKFPKALGACADLLFKLKAERLAAQKKLEAMEAEEKALKEHIIAALPKSQASGVAGKVARVTVYNKEIPQVEDWNLFYRFVKKEGRFDLMQRRLSEKAVSDMLEEGEKVPGVKVFKTPVVSLNKV
jgi:hypothetical protein